MRVSLAHEPQKYHKVICVLRRIDKERQEEFGVGVRFAGVGGRGERKKEFNTDYSPFHPFHLVI